MKKIVAIALVLCMCIGIAGCGKEEKSDKSKKENNASSVAKLENYKLVEKNVDYSEPEKNEFIFAGEDGQIVIKGYKDVKNFYCGNAIAVDLEGNKTIINTKGKEVLPEGRYEEIRALDSYYGSKFYYAQSIETGKEGIIDAKGNEIVKCEYDDISVNATNVSYRQSKYIFKCEKDDVISLFTEGGKKIDVEGTVSSYGFFKNDEDYLMIVVISNDEKYYYNEETGKLLFKESDFGKNFNWVSNTRVANYRNESNEYEAVIFAKDYSKAIKSGIAYVNTAKSMGDYILVDYNNAGTAIFDNAGNEKHYFEKDVTASCDNKGNISYKMKSGNSYILYNKEFERVAEITGARNVNSGHGFFYSIPSDGDKTKCTMYDSNGKVIYENLTMVDFLHKDRSIYKLSDGTNAYKSVNNKEMVTGGQNETYKSSYMESTVFVFTNEAGEYVLRDEKLNELCKFDAYPEFQEVFNLFKVDGKYYNKNGKLIYEKE